MNARKAWGLPAALLTLALSPVSAQDRTSDWNLLRELLVIPGLSGQEGRVMDFIQSRLPASLAAQRDAKGNLWFTVGRGRPHLLFAAHADELGFTAESITEQGFVRLRGRGGFLPQTLEGAPFVVYTGRGPLEGVIRPRSDYQAAEPEPFAPEAYELDIGTENAEDARRLGIAAGDPVIYTKVIVDLGPELLAARAVDDRAGCAALLAAVLQTDWSGVKDKTITCAWTVEEEIGLRGAAVLAGEIKPDYVFAVDTFVSSDSPLEDPIIAFAPLGKGAVLRALDSSSLTPRPQLLRMLALADRAKIPVQLGISRGGNDGSVFVPGGAVDIPLSWPGVYAHSFIEKIDRRDLGSLVRLIKAVMEGY
jgi:putative aminopeptidase FrvX